MQLKWLTKLGEGILIGLGASLAFFIINTMLESTKKLDGATGKILKQHEINTEFTDATQLNSKEIQSIKKYISEELQKTNSSLDKLANTVESMDKNNGKQSHESFKIDPALWKKLQSNTSSIQPLPKITPASSWPIADENNSKLFENLNNLIKIQGEIPLK